jgi:ABC-2 type transport system permease protein
MRRGLIWWSIAMFAFSLYMMTFFPSVQKGADDMQEYIDNLPDSFKAMMGGEVDISTVEGFLSMEVFSFFYPFMILAFAVTYGAGMIGGEEDSGTLDLLLATPVPRWRIVLEKFAALVVFTLIVLAMIFLGFAAGAALVDIGETNWVRILEGVINFAPFALFFAALTLAVTGIKGGRGLALGVVLGVAALTYLISTMGEVSDVPEALMKLSPWHYYNGVNVMRDGLNYGNMGLLLGLTVLLVGAAMWGFERRDVGV